MVGVSDTARLLIEPHTKVNHQILFLLWLQMSDSHMVSGSIIMFSKAACHKTLIFGICSAILSKYFCYENVISFERTSPHFPIPSIPTQK